MTFDEAASADALDEREEGEWPCRRSMQREKI
jgi:hypothetical protein